MEIDNDDEPMEIDDENIEAEQMEMDGEDNHVFQQVGSNIFGFIYVLI